MNVENNARDDDVVLADGFQRAVHYWWLTAIFVITGGLLGLVVSMLAKPVYESTSHITTVIEYATSGRLTDYEEDHLLTAVGDIISSDAVLILTAAEAVQAGIVPSEEVGLQSLIASRQGYRWVLLTRLSSPADAMQLNQIWLENSTEALDEFRRDSILALAQIQAQAEVEACFQQSVSLEPVSPYCTIEEMQSLLANLQSADVEPASGSLRARLLAARLSYQVTAEPSLPMEPVHYHRATTVLAGAALGLIVVVGLFLFGFWGNKQ